MQNFPDAEENPYSDFSFSQPFELFIFYTRMFV